MIIFVIFYYQMKISHTNLTLWFSKVFDEIYPPMSYLFKVSENTFFDKCLLEYHHMFP